MKSYMKESEPFTPVCKDYFSDWCIDHCNWFGTCWDFQEDVNDTIRTRVSRCCLSVPDQIERSE